MISYKIYKKSISNSSSNNLFKNLLSICKFYKPKIFKSYQNYPKKWIDKEFISGMVLLRKNKRLFSSIYDTMRLSNELKKIPFHNNLHKIASNFLKVDERNLMMRSIQLRMDFPHDTRNSYGWHQDNAYDRYNLQSKNGAILWIPLIDTNKKNGTLMIKPGSQNSTYKCSRKVSSGNKYKSEQILVQKKYLRKYKSKSIDVKKNQCLTTFNGMFHKSGLNISNEIRFTIIVRFNNMLCKDFLFFRNLKSKTAQQFYD